MAMFRSLVSSSQHRQHHHHQAQTAPSATDSLETQYGCPICLEVYYKPVAIGSCGHTFCGECLQPCLQVTSPLCPLCRMPFDPKKVDKASNVDKQLSSYKAPCRGCSKKITLAKMRSHISSCAKVQEQMANCPKFVPVVPTSQPIPSNIPNRSTFICPYCGARNLDQQELVKHCMENHRSDLNKVVCPICSAMPWGDPSYKSANFLQHLLHRHKFSYDTFVDYSIDEEAALQAALALSLSEN
ncbi:E3 ubiquitin-protein ligase RNF166 [Bombina bombina]|uniref:E3 ubiquitin-protein ligase RNF166 n=1 Tax=Bombina bombina TaxID=8345 RepID=UPI00235B0DEE|nr:E3 ubiquitin-protein ligase RNF166 [Bombina bombina]